MAIPHASSGQVIGVQPLSGLLASAKTTALFKSEQLEVIRLVLLAGKSFPSHSVPGEITLQCLEGQIEVAVDGQHHRLSAGDMLFLAQGVPHAVTALQDASALLTIVLAK